jgi:hypothetical protein
MTKTNPPDPQAKRQAEMAEKKTGPVKPPIIDATARPSDKDKPAPESKTAETAKTSQKPEPAQATPKSAQATKPDPKPTSGSGATGTASDDKPKPSDAKAGSEADAASKAERPSAVAALPLVPLAATAGAGALVGLALAYGLASFGYWPQPGQAPDLSQFDARAARLESAIASREAESEQIADRINGLEAQIAGIEPASTEGLAAQADLDAMNAQIGELSSRIEAIAAGASGDEVSEVANNLSGLSTQIGDLANRLDTLEPQIAETQPMLETAMTRLDDLDARIASQSDFEAVAAERDRATQLPAALGALETAIASGQPFAAQLASVETLLPDLEISSQVRTAANAGVASASGLLAQLRAAIPEILAARPRDEQAGWAQTLLDQAASAIALRPTDGDTPQALVGRTEAALDAGELDAARAAFSALPDPMQSAAPQFASGLDRAIAVEALLDAARSGIAPAEASQ